MITWQEKNGNIVYENGTFKEISGTAALVQRTRNRVARWVDEFEYDGEGVNWLDLFEADILRIRAVLKAYIESDSDYIESVTDIEIERDSANRTAKVTFSAKTTGGEILPVTVEV